MKTKDKIILTSIDLFNKSGVVAVTTNHIAKELNISPGNLYFHFRNKEEIIRHIYKMACQERTNLWRTTKGHAMMHPLELIEKTLDLFWKYRFLHREMYYLRQKDSQLNKMWTDFGKKITKMINLMYLRWVKLGWMKTYESDAEAKFMTNVLLATPSTFLHFVENSQKLSAAKINTNGKNYVARLLVHWTVGDMRKDFEASIEADDAEPA